MNAIIKEIEAAQLKENVPQFNVGDTVKVYGKIKEGNRERIQVFEGVVLKKQGGGARETFTVNNHNDLVNKIRNGYGQYGTMMHGRWVENGYFGDEITLTSNVSIAKDATKENPANIILNMQMGPQCLVSLYGANDKLLTQDCHMYHNYSISTKWYERKMEKDRRRGRIPLYSLRTP